MGLNLEDSPWYIEDIVVARVALEGHLKDMFAETFGNVLLFDFQTIIVCARRLQKFDGPILIP